MRVAVLWSHRSGYFDACIRALGRTVDQPILVAYQRSSPEAPFDTASRIADVEVEWSSKSGEPRISDALRRFEPDTIVVSGWQNLAYRRLLREFKEHAVRVLCMDNQWHGTPKQILGVLTSRIFLHPLFDLVFVPGERQAAFAMRLGFRRDAIATGLYSADVDAFRPSDGSRPRHEFIFLGRLSPEKGIEELVAAYRRYRNEAREPWRLRVVGTGPLQALLDDEPGIDLSGFVQPEDVPKLLGGAGALVLPSRFEPWGVAVHEATAAGLPVVCTSEVGAATHLVSEGLNGQVVPARDIRALARGMNWVADMNDKERRSARTASECLSRQYSPELFAQRLLSHVHHHS